ncbi:MAG TPA: small ribosomal subunit Rsm22 family protein [Bacteriovoracaceae bacterium]|nr:small ribosomal subunit Rsm22 family protein [Bacteriovoracaceae bacterium]
MPFLLHEFSSESDLVKAIEEVSEKFTSQRENISHYLSDKRLTSAYTAFYLTTNFPKLREVFRWLPPEWTAALKHCNFIDVGAGPGTFSLAWKMFGGEGKIYQVETSEVMTLQAKRLWEGLMPNSPVEYLKTIKKMPNSFLFFGHSANEMGAAKVIRYVEDTTPEHILFIEPGTKSFFPEMLKIRDYLLSRNFNVLFPCPTALECPMKNSSEDWCHQIIHVRQEDDVERLTQLVKKDRRTLPLTVHAYSRQGSFKTPQERLVRVLPDTKFSFEWEVCHNNNLEHYQVMKRNLEKSRLKELALLVAGSSVETILDKNIEQTKRVEIIKFHK